MQDKCTTPKINPQHLIAGLLQKDCNIEFYGLPETMKVEWLQHGRSRPFHELPRLHFSLLASAYHSNPTAREHLSIRVEKGSFISFSRQVELYTYFMYGGLDHKPDIQNGTLKQPENYRHQQDCISLHFKKIRLNGSPLKPREITMIDLMAREEDFIDEVIATKMGLARSTYNQYKKELFTKTGIISKPGLMVAAMRQRIIRNWKKPTS